MRTTTVLFVLMLAGCIAQKDVGHNNATDEVDAGDPSVDAGDPSEAGYTLLTQGPPWAIDVVSDADQVYWVACNQEANRSSLRRIAKVGGPDTELWLVGKRIYRLAIDPTHVYAAVYGVNPSSTGGTGDIARIPVSGGEPELLVTGLENPYAIAVDQQHVYFTHQGDGNFQSISRVAKTGGTVETVLSPLENPWDLATDEQYLYYSEMNAGRMMRVAKNGGTPQELAGGWIGTGTLTMAGDTVYFTACSTGDCPQMQLRSVPKNGGESALLAIFAGQSEGRIAVGGESVFVASVLSGTVVSVPRSGGATQVLVDGRPGPMSVTADADGARAFWVDFPSGEVGRIDLAEQ